MCSQRRTRICHQIGIIIWKLVTSNARGTIQGICGLQFAGARHYSTLEGEIDTLLVPGRPTGEGLAFPTAPAVVSITGEQMPAGGLDLHGLPISWLKLAFLMVNERRLTGRS